MINKKKVTGYQARCRDCKIDVGEPKLKNTDAKRQQPVKDHERKKGMHRIETKTVKMWVAVPKPEKPKTIRKKIKATPEAILGYLREKGGRPFAQANARLHRGECIGCGKQTRTGKSHPGCVREMATGLETAAEAQDRRMGNWNRVTGGIVYHTCSAKRGQRKFLHEDCC